MVPITVVASTSGCWIQIPLRLTVFRVKFSEVKRTGLAELRHDRTCEDLGGDHHFEAGGSTVLHYDLPC